MQASALAFVKNNVSVVSWTHDLMSEGEEIKWFPGHQGVSVCIYFIRFDVKRKTKNGTIVHQIIFISILICILSYLVMFQESIRHAVQTEEHLIRDLIPIKSQINCMQHIRQNLEQRQQTYVFLYLN